MYYRNTDALWSGLNSIKLTVKSICVAEELLCEHVILFPCHTDSWSSFYTGRQLTGILAVICVCSLSVSDSVFMHALCICAILLQSVDAAGRVTPLHACYINTQKNHAMVPFQAIV